MKPLRFRDLEVEDQLVLSFEGEFDPHVELAKSTDHFLEALVLVVLAMTSAGTTWGLGHAWARLPLVARHRWAR